MAQDAEVHRGGNKVTSSRGGWWGFLRTNREGNRTPTVQSHLWKSPSWWWWAITNQLWKQIFQVTACWFWNSARPHQQSLDCMSLTLTGAGGCQYDGIWGVNPLPEANLPEACHNDNVTKWINNTRLCQVDLGQALGHRAFSLVTLRS